MCWLEILGVSPRVDRLYTRRVEQFADLLVSAAKHLLPLSPLTDEEARITAIAVVGATSQSALFWLLSHYKADRKVLVSATARVLRGTVSVLGSAGSRNGGDGMAARKQKPHGGRLSR